MMSSSDQATKIVTIVEENSEGMCHDIVRVPIDAPIGEQTLTEDSYCSDAVLRFLKSRDFYPEGDSVVTIFVQGSDIDLVSV